MDTATAIETAQAPGVFDVLAFVEETAYPTETVVVFQDVKSAQEYVKLVNERFEKDKNKEDTTELDAQIAELGEKISKSSLIFELRGMPPGVVDNILNVPEGEDPALREKERDNDLIAKSIVQVRNADGAVDPRVWDSNAVSKLRVFLKEGEFGKLIAGVSSVNFNAMVFDQATDAGFSGRGTDVS